MDIIAQGVGRLGRLGDIQPGIGKRNCTHSRPQWERYSQQEPTRQSDGWDSQGNGCYSPLASAAPTIVRHYG
jgi:hypothetical protein